MSWDLVVFAAGTPKAVDADGLASFEPGWTPFPLGSLTEIQRQVTAALPQSQWLEDRWGQYQDADCSMEFNLGSEDPVTSLMIHARGFAIHAVLHLIAVSGWVALDTTTGTWMDDKSSAGAGAQQVDAFLSAAVDLANPPRKPSLWDRLLGRTTA
jgi:hypothetical protein